jgi:hypothetical protein
MKSYAELLSLLERKKDLLKTTIISFKKPVAKKVRPLLLKALRDASNKVPSVYALDAYRLEIDGVPAGSEVDVIDHFIDEYDGKYES